MTTAYPGAIDSFTDPTSANALSDPPVKHSAQHANLNDAMAAVQGALGTNPAGPYPTVNARITAAGVNVKDYGAKGDGTTDDSGAFQNALNASSAPGARVFVPPGVYVIGSTITLSAWSQLEALEYTKSRFGAPAVPGGSAWGATVLKAAAALAAPVVTVNAPGCAIHGITFDGSASTNSGPILNIASGFEFDMDRVRVSQAYGTAIAFAGSCDNSQCRNIYVDNCGRDNASTAVTITSAGSAARTNTLVIDAMHIERMGAGALDIGWGTTVDVSYAEFVKLSNLHIEAPYGDASAPAPPATPLVRVGTVTSLDLIAPFLYHGGGQPMIVHNQQTTQEVSGGQTGSSGGIKIYGGTLMGSPAANTGQPTAYAVTLTAGRAFTMFGTEVFRVGTAVAQVASTYSPEVKIDARTAPLIPAMSDARTVSYPVPHRAFPAAVVYNASAVTLTATAQTILTQNVQLNMTGVLTVDVDIDLVYATAGDVIVFNLTIGGGSGTGSLVYSAASSTGRIPCHRSWTYPIASNPGSTTVTVTGVRYSGTGTTHQVNPNSSMRVRYETTT